MDQEEQSYVGLFYLHWNNVQVLLAINNLHNLTGQRSTGTGGESPIQHSGRSLR